MSGTEEQAEWIEGLRSLADLLGAHPELAPAWSGEEINLFPDTIDEARSMMRALGGTWQKTESGRWLAFVLPVGPHQICVNLTKAGTCERVEIGTEEVPDPAAPKITVPKYEWRCPESLLRLAAEVAP